MIATLPMYDWPEHRAANDALWAAMRDALSSAGFDAPAKLIRNEPLEPLWTAQDLLIAETCSWPLATSLAGRVRYVATLVRTAPGCEDGFYRSAVVARSEGHPDAPVPEMASAELPSLTGKTLAYNGLDSLSGYVALATDAKVDFDDRFETGSHRASIIAVAEGRAEIAAIDAYTWHLARRYEPMAQHLSAIGWTARRPALPLVTNASVSDDDLDTMRQAVLDAVPAVMHDDPLVNVRSLSQLPS